MPAAFDKTPEEDKAIQALRAKMGSNLRQVHDDRMLLEWLKESKMNVDLAATHMTNSNAFVKQHNIESYEQKPVLKDYWAGGYVGLDKEGAPVRVELLGSLDMKGLMRSATKSEMERYKLAEYERMQLDQIARSEASGKRSYGLTTIVDMEGVGSEWLWRPGLQIYFHLVNMLEEHYPETIKRLLVINAPGLFPLLFKIGRTFMREGMKEKLEVMGTNYKEGLLKYIEPDQLPLFLGGTQTDDDGDGFCPSKITIGGKVPVRLYTPLESEMAGMQCKEVHNGQKFSLDFDVDQENTILSWSFRTEDNDIGFGINLKVDDKKELVLPMKREPSHHIIVTGSLVCPKIGTYEVCFDNSYSWATSKVLYYHVECHMRDEELMSEVDNMSFGGSWSAVNSA